MYTGSFQTNPRGVEALTSKLPPSAITSFRRTLVGLKPPTLPTPTRRWVAFQTNPRGVEANNWGSASASASSFRRTLVGLKRRVAGIIVSRLSGFRRTLVGLKPARGVDSRGNFRVSDEPSWG